MQSKYPPTLVHTPRYEKYEKMNGTSASNTIFFQIYIFFLSSFSVAVVVCFVVAAMFASCEIFMRSFLFGKYAHNIHVSRVGDATRTFLFVRSTNSNRTETKMMNRWRRRRKRRQCFPANCCCKRHHQQKLNGMEINECRREKKKWKRKKWKRKIFLSFAWFSSFALLKIRMDEREGESTGLAYCCIWYHNKMWSVFVRRMELEMRL